MKTEMDKAVQRTWQYWYVDGLNEIAFGALCLLLGIYFYLEATLPVESLLANLLDSSLIVIIIGGFFLASWAVKTAKTRLTFPRTGYVSYQKSSGKKRWLAAVLAIGIGALVAALMASTPAVYDWMPAFTGLVFAVVLLVLAYRIDLLRFYLLSALSAVLGFALSLSGLGNILGLAIFYSLVGLALLLSGGLTLWSYLRRYPRPEEEAA